MLTLTQHKEVRKGAGCVEYWAWCSTVRGLIHRIRGSTGNELNLALRDESVALTDTFGYLVDFIVIPRVGLNVTTGIERGTATGLETVPFPTPSHADFVLTGWAFNFQPGDREILDIGVLRGTDSFTVFYGDSGGGEPFDWRVEWAHVAPMLVAPA